MSIQRGQQIEQKSAGGSVLALPWNVSVRPFVLPVLNLVVCIAAAQQLSLGLELFEGPYGNPAYLRKVAALLSSTTMRPRQHSRPQRPGAL